MQSSLYVALSGQVALQKRLDTIANNIANVNTGGFRAEEVSFSTLVSRAGAAPTAFATSGENYISRKNGEMNPTGSPLDIAVQGNAWFAVKTPDGVAYTRDGRLHIDNSGALLTVNNYPILDAGGASMLLDPSAGAPAISQDGMISQDGRSIGAVGLYAIDANAKLSRYDNSAVLSDLPGSAVLDFTNNGVMQGMSEGSNVNRGAGDDQNDRCFALLRQRRQRHPVHRKLASGRDQDARRHILTGGNHAGSGAIAARRAGSRTAARSGARRRRHHRGRPLGLSRLRPFATRKTRRRRQHRRSRSRPARRSGQDRRGGRDHKILRYAGRGRRRRSRLPLPADAPATASLVERARDQCAGRAGRWARAFATGAAFGADRRRAAGGDDPRPGQEADQERRARHRLFHAALRRPAHRRLRRLGRRQIDHARHAGFFAGFRQRGHRAGRRTRPRSARISRRRARRKSQAGRHRGFDRGRERDDAAAGAENRDGHRRISPRSGRVGAADRRFDHALRPCGA